MNFREILFAEDSKEYKYILSIDNFPNDVDLSTEFIDYRQRYINKTQKSLPMLKGSVSSTEQDLVKFTLVPDEELAKNFEETKKKYETLYQVFLDEYFNQKIIEFLEKNKKNSYFSGITESPIVSITREEDK